MALSGARWEQGFEFLYFGSAGDTSGSTAGAIIPDGDFVLNFDEETETLLAVFEGWSAIKNKMGSNSGTNWNTAYKPWVDLVANHFGMVFSHWTDPSGETYFELQNYRNLFDNLQGVFLNKNWLDDNSKTDMKELMTETIGYEKHYGKLYVTINWTAMD